MKRRGGARRFAVSITLHIHLQPSPRRGRRSTYAMCESRWIARSPKIPTPMRYTINFDTQKAAHRRLFYIYGITITDHSDSTNRLMAARDSSLMSCSILQASSAAMSWGTPRRERRAVRMVCRS